MNLKKMSIITSLLCVLSLIVYAGDNRRGSDLAEGSEFIKGIDVNNIAKIELTFPGNKKIEFERDSAFFVISNKKSYPASSAKINEMIFKIANIQVSEKVDSGVVEVDDLKQYGLDKSNLSYKVAIFDGDGNVSVSFIVGKNLKNKGNYIKKEKSGDVYLSQNRIWLDSTYKEFVDLALLNLEKNNVKALDMNLDQKFSLMKDGDKIKSDNGEKEVDQKKFNKLIDGLNSLTFKDFYSVTDPNVQTLKFDSSVSVELDNSLIYNLNFAIDNDRYFAKLSATVEDMPSQITVTQEDGKEELSKIEEQIKAQSTSQLFNMKKAVWVYEIEQSKYKELLKLKEIL